MGDRLINIQSCIEKVREISHITKISKIYETEPWGVLDQPQFLNLCLEIETDDSPNELLIKLKNIENEIGRKKTEKWGPRLIDIDILYFDNLILNQDRLNIPHERIEERLFVLVPLNEIAPNYRDPVSSKTVNQMLNDLEITGISEFNT